MRLYVLFGLPASGKTTLARQYEAQRGCKVHSYDDLYASLKDSRTDSEINDIWVQGIRSDLLAGRDVVCDGNCIQAHQRMWLLSKLADIPCRKTLVAVVTPTDECIRRNAQREGSARVPEHCIRDAAKYMQPPTNAEGWDEITVYID